LALVSGSLLVTVGASQASAQVLSEATLAFVGGTVIDGSGGDPMENAVVLVRGDRIQCVGTPDDCPAPDGATVVDVTGRFLTPGLVDAHVHFSQTGWLDGRPDGLPAAEIYPYLETSRANRSNPGRWHRSYLCTGITAVFDVGGHPWTTALPEAFEDRDDGAHVRAAGPLVTFGGRPELQADEEMYTFLPMGSDAEALESVDAVAGMGSSALKVWYLRVPAQRREEMDARLMKVGERARSHGLDLIVHSTGLREAKAALRAGAKVLVHSVEDQPVDEEFLQLARANGTVYLPTLVVGENWGRAVISVAMDTPQTLDDTNGCVDPNTVAKVNDTATLQAFVPERNRGNLEYALERMRRTGRTQAVMAANLRRVHEAGITVATATDAGNPLTLHGPSIYNEMESMQVAGIPAPEILVMSTRNGARAMNRENDFGTLESGKIADLLILAEDPTEDVRAFRSVTHVMRAGTLHEQAALRLRPVS
jgi:imidazolonepropionase-like amidohydrolase